MDINKLPELIAVIGIGALIGWAAGLLIAQVSEIDIKISGLVGAVIGAFFSALSILFKIILL